MILHEERLDSSNVMQLFSQYDLIVDGTDNFATRYLVNDACVLLDKPSRRVENVRTDYAGFEIPDLFVVGYGLDFAERYRNLPFVGVLKPEIYRG